MAIIEITLLFLGSVIGAGFATGAEIITFFGNSQLPIWCIAIIIGLTMFAVITLEIHLNDPRAKQNKQLSQNLPTSKLKLDQILNLVLIIIYVVLFTAMTAGITQITNIGVSIIALIISTFIVCFGFSHLSRLNFYIVLIIIILIITTALPHLSQSMFNTNYRWYDLLDTIFGAFLYAGLNCFMFPELIRAAAQQNQRRTLMWAGVITACLVTILVGLILTTIKDANTQNDAIPLLAAAPNAITMIIILLAVLTSQYAALFAILQRCQKLIPVTKKCPLLSAVCICICALLGSFCGFKQIVNFAYPLIGAFTCVCLLLSWLFSWLKKCRNP